MQEMTVFSRQLDMHEQDLLADIHRLKVFVEGTMEAVQELINKGKYELADKFHERVADKLEGRVSRVVEKFNQNNPGKITEDKIPKPKSLKSAENYTFPESMQPKFIQTEINREIAPVFNQMGSRINNVILSRGCYSNIKNIKKEEAAIIGLMVGIELTVGFIRQRKTLEKKRTEVEKLQADVDKCCEEFAGAIKSLGVAASEIQYLRKLHDDAVNYMIQYYETVKNLSNKKKISDEYLLEENEIKAVETFYMGGKQLVRLMQVDIMKSASR